mgnify:CR=1 FL=1
MSWKKEELGKICKTSSGGTPSRKYPEYYENGEIPWVKSGELENNTIISAEECISRDGLENSNAKIFPPGTLLIALYGATIGKLAFLGIEAATNQAVCGIFENEKVTLKYLYYFLLFNRPNLIKKGMGGAQSNISQTILKQLLVPYPVSMNAQMDIVSRIEELFSKLDKGVETLQTIKQQLAVYRQAVYSSNFNKIRDFRPIVDFFEISGGLTKNSKRKELPQQVPYLRVANVYYNCLELDVIKTIGVTEKELQKCSLKTSDLLFVEGNGSKSQIGRVAMWDGSIETCVHQNHLIRGRANGKILPKYALYYLISQEGRKQIVDIAKSTSGLYTLSINKVKNLQIPFCSRPEQETILNEIEARLSVCDSIEQTVDEALAQADAMRQSILKQAFEGEI